MYWTKQSIEFGGIVFKSGMDGSSPISLVSGSGNADGIVIDLRMKRLYWAHWGRDKTIQSSNLHGANVVTVHQFPSQAPYGITLLGERLYWSYWARNRVESGGIQPGSDVRVEHIGNASNTGHFTVPIWNPPSDGVNSCKEVACSGVCVLTPSFSFKCLSL